MTMRMRAVLIPALVVAGMIAALPQSAEANHADGGRGNGPVIYVTSQELYFDSIVTADPVPPVGPFQLLYDGSNGLTTDAGPGDPGYVGGRWWVDANGNGRMDEGDAFFVCPLLPPGRETP